MSSCGDITMNYIAMATPAVTRLTAGKRLLRTSFYPSDLNDKLFSVPDHSAGQLCSASTRNAIVAKKSSNVGPNYQSNSKTQAITALKEYMDASSFPSATHPSFEGSSHLEEGGTFDVESSLEALILLQKSMLEKQWKLTFDQASQTTPFSKTQHTNVTRSGLSARQRRYGTRRNGLRGDDNVISLSSRRKNIVSPDLLQRHVKGYIRGMLREDLLSHAEVVHLSGKIKVGLSLEERRARLKEKLGFEPSDKQLASSLNMSYAEVQSKLIACSLAREKLVMSNVRLVLSIAQKYDNLGAEMADLVQGGLIGLIRGIEKFDSSKGFRISTYVYWWIRQGVSRALVENSRTLRLPSHLHERLCSIKVAKVRLEEKGIMPSIDKIAEVLNMSEKKIRNATEAVSKVFSLDREAFPSLNGLPGETLHSYIADTHLENNPWHGYEEWSIKDEVNKLLTTALGEREREIIRLYYGLESESRTWEDISRQFGLSRERVRQVGLVALEKLKYAARRKKLGAMLVKH